MADGAIVLQTCLKTLVISFAIPFGATSGAENYTRFNSWCMKCSSTVYLNNLWTLLTLLKDSRDGLESSEENSS